MPTVPRLSSPRRDFLKRSVAAGVALGLPMAPARAGAQGASAAPSRRARHVIFMVADGMSSGTLQLADVLSRMTPGRSRPLRWVELWSRPGVRRASCSTAPADGHVCDSAAAASAWGIGERVNNGAINFTPDGRTPGPIHLIARGAGRATGLVTTTRVTHATPAGFIANISDRDLEREIAGQILERRVDVVLGGGARYFPEAALAARDDLRVVRTRDDLLAHHGSGPLLGLFADSHMSYSLDRAEAEPTLAEMTGAALRLLARRAEGFVLQVEGGRVDHAAHANDAAAMLHDMLAFDDAVGTALEFIADRDDTLLIITTDHGCANPGLTYYGKQGLASFERLRRATRSFEWIMSRAREVPDEAARALEIPNLVERATGISLTPEERAVFFRSMRGEPVDPFRPAGAPVLVLGSLLANHTGVAFLSPNHTSDFVEVTALGPGSERLAPMIENTRLHTLMLEAAAIAS